MDEGFPSKFYKYRAMDPQSARWVERTVLNDEIYFAPANSFNDPFELRPVFSLSASPERQRDDFIRMSRKFEPHLTEEVRSAQADQVMQTAMAPENVEETRNVIQMLHNIQITSAVGIYCVSERADNILMWAHYADSHKGICLEFDGYSVEMANAQQVLYSDKRTPLNVYDDDVMSGMEKALLTKSSHWSYEKEWRILRYQHGPGVAKIAQATLTGIIVGAMSSRETLDRVVSWARSRKRPIRVMRAKTSQTRFDLEVHAVSLPLR